MWERFRELSKRLSGRKAGPGTRLTPEIRQMIIDLRESGMSFRDIAEELNLPLVTVHRVWRAYGEVKSKKDDDVETVLATLERVRQLEAQLRKIRGLSQVEQGGMVERIAYAFGLGIGQWLEQAVQRGAFAQLAQPPSAAPTAAGAQPIQPPAAVPVGPAPAAPPAAVPAQQPAPAEPAEPEDLETAVLRILAFNMPEQAAPELARLAETRPDFKGAFDLLKALDPQLAEVYISEVEKMGAVRLAAFFRQTPDYLPRLLAALKKI